MNSALLLLAAALAAGGPRAESAAAPTAALAPDGTLWVVWVEDTRVLVSASRDLGRTFSPAVPVNPEPEVIDAHGEARPKIALGPHGQIYVSYTHRLAKPYSGEIRFSRSVDGGRSFSPPLTVNDDGLETGHRFDTLAVAPSGDVHLFWIDKRDLERSREAYAGAALYHAVSRDGGSTFSRNEKVKDHVCECCRLAVAWDHETPILLWRDLMDSGVRDHSLVRWGQETQAVVRATDDDWKIAGCPHHGPALAVDRKGVVHLAWFTGNGKSGGGTFYRRSTDGGRSFSEPLRLGTGSGTGRPQIVAAGKTLWLAWKESTDDLGGTVVRAMRSTDGGARWSPAREIARGGAGADHPLLLSRKGRAFLSWFTRADGYRVLRLS